MPDKPDPKSSEAVVELIRNVWEGNIKDIKEFRRFGVHVDSEVTFADPWTLWKCTGIVYECKPLIINALLAAILKGNVEVTSLLLDLGANVDTLVKGLGSVLIVAVRGRKRDIVRLMLSRKVDVNVDVSMMIGGCEQGTALIAAVEGNDEDMVQLLLNNGAADPNVSVSSKGECRNGTALLAAVDILNENIVRLLLDHKADINYVHSHNEFGTALIAAAYQRNSEIVRLLLERGADVNCIHSDGEYGTALIAAARAGDEDTVRLLLNWGADVNSIHPHGKYGTALIAAVRAGDEDAVQILLDWGADVNYTHGSGKYGTALITAARGSNPIILQRLLQLGGDREADVNLSVYGKYSTPLFAAIAAREPFNARLLLERGADGRMLGGEYGTGLITAIHMADELRKDIYDSLTGIFKFEGKVLLQERLDTDWEFIWSNLLRVGQVSDAVNIVVEGYGTALTAAISQFHFNPELRVPSKYVSKGVRWEWGFLETLLQYVGGSDNINMVAGKYGTAMIVAISKKKTQVVPLLVSHGADVNRVIGRHGTALSIAVDTYFCAPKDPRRYDVLSMLLDQGADINTVTGDSGTVLGKAAYMGDSQLVSFLLSHGADAFNVGGNYQTKDGTYPNALDAAQSPGSKAGAELIALLLDRYPDLKGDNIIQCPPFPMPYTRLNFRIDILPSPRGADSCACRCEPQTTLACAGHKSIFTLPAHETLSPQQADLPCTSSNKEVTVQALAQLVIGIPTDSPEFHPGWETWIQNDVRYFVAQAYDFGSAYAAARVAWRRFNSESAGNHNIALHRAQWLRSSKEIQKARDNSIQRDNTGMEVIRLPYEVTPRRLWDITSNRVVEYQMLHSEALAYKYTMELQFGESSLPLELPGYWAISHSWTDSMNTLDTPINQYQWPVPLPSALDIECDLRQELLTYEITYVWLDVLCLRMDSPRMNETSKTVDLGAIRINEWKIDIPTIGNIFKAAQGVVRYFNGLGMPFNIHDWDSPRHWLNRAWTLQETRNENSTINGGIFRESVESHVILNTCGIVNGKATTMRHVVRPVLRLAADLDGPTGCTFYGLAGEMTRRHSTMAIDKVAGLFYLLRPSQLPIYTHHESNDEAWMRCIHVLPWARKRELLFDFPYRGEANQQWFPTWSQLMRWPRIDPLYDDNVVTQANGHISVDKQDLMKFKSLGKEVIEASLFISDIWAISHVTITNRGSEGIYNIPLKNRFYGFYSPYMGHYLEIKADKIYTLATPDLGNSNNWVVCEITGVVEKVKLKKDDVDVEVEVEALKKIGVLRTDFCGELMARGKRGGSALRKINALFV